jgi:prophage regulatory protein
MKEHEMPNIASILRLADVEARCAVNRRTLYYWMERGMFPRPIHLGPRTVGWLNGDIEAWINDKAQASRVAPYRSILRSDRHDG